MKYSDVLSAVLFLFVRINGNVGETSEKVVVCAMQENAAIHAEEPAFTPEKLDPTICTHILYNGAQIDSDGFNLKPRNPEIDFYDNDGLGLYNRTIKMKEVNPNLKILLQVCCVRHFFWDNKEFVFRTPGIINSTTISTFTENVVNYVQLYGFDGINLSWKEHENMSQLMSTLRTEFDKHGYILTSFFSPFRNDGEDDFHIPPEMAESVDLVLVGSYWKELSNETFFFSSTTQLKKYITAYLEQGFPSQKLVVAVPTVALTVRLCDHADTGLSAAICSARFEGKEDPDEQLMGYNKLVQKLRDPSEGWTVERDNVTNMSYAHTDSLLWVSYEDPVSVRVKSQYVLEKNLRGIAIMTVDTDDFVGHKDDGVKFPLTRAAYDTLRGN